VAVREVLRYPDPALKRVAPPVPVQRNGRPDEAAARVAADVLDTMRAFPGCVGLAAPQLDEPLRIVVVDVTAHRKTTACHGELVLVNPAIVATSGSEIAREGCLSIPELTANVRRALAITLTAITPDGAPVRIETEGFEARCLQHELDHLDGVLFLDRVQSLTDDVFRRKSGRRRPGADEPRQD